MITDIAKYPCTISGIPPRAPQKEKTLTTTETEPIKKKGILFFFSRPKKIRGMYPNIQTPADQTVPKTPSQEIFGCLGIEKIILKDRGEKWWNYPLIYRDYFISH